MSERTIEARMKPFRSGQVSANTTVALDLDFLGTGSIISSFSEVFDDEEEIDENKRLPVGLEDSI
jgi:hypothetical protein